MNTRAKGKFNENKVRAKYTENGYLTYKPPSTKYGEQDIFGLWDLLLFDGLFVKLVQVKSRMTHASSFKKKSEKWLTKYCLEPGSPQPNYAFWFELFVVLPKGKVRKFTWNHFYLKWEEDKDESKFYK